MDHYDFLHSPDNKQMIKLNTDDNDHNLAADYPKSSTIVAYP